MTTNRLTAAKTKPARTLDVQYSHTFAEGRQLVRVNVKEGSKRDAYHVSRDLDSCEVRWAHASDDGRSYVVVCSAGSGVPVACTCPARVECRHRAGTRALLNEGLLDCGPERGEEPEGYGWDDERVEAQADYWRAVDLGGSFSPHR
jgi:hypothetical protein